MHPHIEHMGPEGPNRVLFSRDDDADDQVSLSLTSVDFPLNSVDFDYLKIEKKFHLKNFDFVKLGNCSD